MLWALEVGNSDVNRRSCSETNLESRLKTLQKFTSELPSSSPRIEINLNSEVDKKQFKVISNMGLITILNQLSPEMSRTPTAFPPKIVGPTIF